MRLRGTRWPVHAYLTSALGHLGRIDVAKKALEELKDIQPQASISFVKENHPTINADFMDHLLDGLRKAGIAE